MHMGNMSAMHINVICLYTVSTCMPMCRLPDGAFQHQH